MPKSTAKYCQHCGEDVSNMSRHKKSQYHIANVIQWGIDNKEIGSAVKKNEEGVLWCHDCNCKVTNKTQHLRRDYHRENFAARVENRPSNAAPDENGVKKLTRVWMSTPTGIRKKSTVAGRENGFIFAETSQRKTSADSARTASPPTVVSSVAPSAA
ncbi:hypothetical protein HK097_005791 [Rhizophlyctis rosea]|uniref:Uncharacterized protein n=1 Tax=Rhizophlyctis rosea TaxID=64517 RepID=A0AAD5SEQ1_9FUNG|nr:hypothetical protein HK097_005791 [Rhizophlyctis rosea]